MMSTLFASQQLQAALIVFVRLSIIVSLLPGFSASYVSGRIRLLLAVALSLLITPLVAASMPPLPDSIGPFVRLIVGEAVVGAFLGMIPRIAISALQTAGTLTSYFASLTSAVIQDPVVEQQSSILAGFFGTLGVVLIFVTGLHEPMLRGLVSSYQVFPAGEGLPLGDASEALARAVAQSFALGLQIAMPPLIGCIVSNLALGLLGRLMPQLNVFFFGMPLQISLQLFLVMITLSGVSILFLNDFANVLSIFGRG